MTESQGRYPRRELRAGIFFLLPLALFLLVFVLLPVLGALVGSLFRDVPFLDRQFWWLTNYGRVLSDPAFLQSLRFTLLFIAVSVPLELLLGMVFALLLNLKIPVRGLLRVCVLIPWAVPHAISARAWELILNYGYGLANYLVLTAGLASEPVNWLGTPASAFFSVVLADVWKTAPFVAIILLAGLQTIPKQIYEQARVDRANFVQIFFLVTLPILRPVIVVALIFRTVDALRVFDLIYVLTAGGPGGATTPVSLYAYRYYLSGDYGSGSAVSILLFLVALGFSLVFLKTGRFGREVL